jgi:hypothetical protein
MMCQPRQKSWPGRNTKPAQQPAERIPRHEIRGLPEDPLPHEKAEWADQKTPFKLSFYHQGMHFDTPVKINEVTADNVEEIKYDPTASISATSSSIRRPPSNWATPVSACCTRSTRPTSKTKS